MKLFLGQYPVRLTDTHRLNPAVANISLAADIDRIMEADLNVHFRLVPENNLAMDHSPHQLNRPQDD